MASEPTLSSLAELAAAASSEVSDPSSSTQGRSSEKFQTKEQLRRHYIKTLHRVIDESDVILLVLDARDPEGCRSRLVEEEVRRRESQGKRLVFVLNKVGEYSCIYVSFYSIIQYVERTRSHSYRQCTSMAEVSATHYAYVTFPLRVIFKLEQYFNCNFSCSCQAAEGVSAIWKAEHNCWCCGLPECWKE